MSCNAWNEQWVARLYGELDPDEERRLEQHVAQCESCRATLDELERSRALLREGTPSVPQAPRAVVLRASAVGSPVWGFAVGLAAALAVFAVGAYSGVALFGERATEPAVLGAGASDDAARRASLEERIVALEAELERVAAAREPAAAAVPAAGRCATPEEVARSLAQLEEQVRYDRLSDVDYLMGEMRSIERRAAGWVDETREAVRLVALTSDPRLSER